MPRMYVRRPLEERFWEKVQKGHSCWVWTAATDRGYGIFRSGKRTVFAHRLAYELTVGPIPDGKSLCHRCDNPFCVNPAHMFVGTQADNLADMTVKGRRAMGVSVANPGERHPAARLTDAVVLEARSRHATGERVVGLASEFGVSVGAMKKAVYGKTWKHLPMR